MCRAKGHAQARAASWHRRWANGRDQEPTLAQQVRQLQGAPGVADENRLNGREAFHQGQTQLLRTLAELRDQACQVLASPVFAAQQLQAAQGRTRQRRWLAGGVNVGAGELHQGLDQFLAAGHKGAGSPEALAQGAYQDRHIIQA